MLRPTTRNYPFDSLNFVCWVNLLILSEYSPACSEMIEKYRYNSVQQDEDYDLPLHMQSPVMKARVNKYKTFRKVLDYLYHVEKYISQTQLNLAKYLYTIENIHILASFEVYLVTRDLNDFIQTLVEILKYHLINGGIVSYIHYPVRASAQECET